MISFRDKAFMYTQRQTAEQTTSTLV